MSREEEEEQTQKAVSTATAAGAGASSVSAPVPVHDLVTSLNLAPHPEGGFYRETFAAPLTVETPRGTRPASTAIYFLQVPEAGSTITHRLDFSEIWYFHFGTVPGAKVVIKFFSDEHHARADQPERTVTLGNDPALVVAGEVLPQVVVMKNTWFSSQCLGPAGSAALVSCQVAPGFVFEDFHLSEE